MNSTTLTCFNRIRVVSLFIKARYLPEHIYHRPQLLAISPSGKLLPGLPRGVLGHWIALQDYHGRELVSVLNAVKPAFPMFDYAIDELALLYKL